MDHEVARQLSKISYVDRYTKTRRGFKTGYIPVLKKGEVSVYVNPKEKKAEIVHRGTNKRKDISADLAIAFGLQKYHPRFQRAKKITEEMREFFPDYKLVHTGHSLGGNIAQEVASKEDEVVTFHKGAGIKDFLFDRKPNQTDYINVYDPVSFLSLGQRGGTQIRSYDLRWNPHTLEVYD